MADVTATLASVEDQKWHDNSDGSYSITVYDSQLASLLTLIGSLSDAEWDGTGNPSSLVALWKHTAKNTEGIL